MSDRFADLRARFAAAGQDHVFQWYDGGLLTPAQADDLYTQLAPLDLPRINKLFEVGSQPRPRRPPAVRGWEASCTRTRTAPAPFTQTCKCAAREVCLWAPQGWVAGATRRRASSRASPRVLAARTAVTFPTARAGPSGRGPPRLRCCTY
jgi:hypothetical protein